MLDAVGRRPPIATSPVLFPTFTFTTFFLVVYGAHVLLRSRPTAWKFAMTAASAVFYSWWDVRFVSLIAGSILFNWWAARSIDRAASRKRKRLVRFTVVTNLAVLGFFKYPSASEWVAEIVWTHIARRRRFDAPGA